MDIAALRTLIDSEPSNAGRTSEEVAAWCNELVSVVGAVTRNTVLKWCVATNALKRLGDFKTSDDVLVQSLAYAALEVIRGDGMDLGDADAQAFLASMVTKEMFSGAEIAALNAKGARQVTRATKELGVPKVEAGWVEELRRAQ